MPGDEWATISHLTSAAIHTAQAPGASAGRNATSCTGEQLLLSEWLNPHGATFALRLQRVTPLDGVLLCATQASARGSP